MSEIISDITKNYYAELSFCKDLPEVEISSPGSFEKLVAGEAESNIYGFSYENGRITFLGSEPLDFTGYILAGIINENQGEVKITYAKNGEVQDVNGGILAANANNKTVNASFETVLNPGDYIELFVRLTESAGKIKIKNLKISLTKK